MKFYDRENERQVLGEVLQQSRREARMTVLMGRRRIGKAELSQRCGDLSWERKPFISTMGNILTSFQSGERSTFVDDAKWRRDNASWLKHSRRVAYAIMDYMQENQFSRNDIAEKLGVSPQYVSKILSGKANFSFKTISEIEECLGIEVFQAAAMEA